MNDDHQKPTYDGRAVLSFIVKAVISLAVLLFLGLHTVNFFMYTFSAENWYYAWLGFGLTGVGAIGYLVLFLWDSPSPLKKVIALLMILVCAAGEVMAAGFGMQIEAWKKSGWQMTQDDFNFMLLVVRLLAFVHALALLGYFAGDEIVALFSRVKLPTVANTPAGRLPTVSHASETVLANPDGHKAETINPTNGE